MQTTRFSTKGRPSRARRHSPTGIPPQSARSRLSKLSVAGIACSVFVLLSAAFIPAASAATKVQLGAATPFAVLAGAGVSDVPTSSITGDVGVSPGPGTAITGLTQAEVDGTIYTTDGTGPTGNVMNPGLLTLAQAANTTAFGTASGQLPITDFGAGGDQLNGKTLVPGTYAFGAGAANLTSASPLVLNGEGDVNAVWVLQASSTLIMGSNSVVQLENGAQACNVFWTVGSSATLDSGSTFVGTIMALTSASLGAGATVQGRVLVQTGAVTLDANTITAPSTCLTSSGGGTTTTTAPGGTGTTPTGGGTTGGGSTTGGSTSGGSGTITNSSGTTPGGVAGSGTGAAAGAAGTSAPAVVPAGFPHTGFGGAAHSRDDGFILIGGLALAGSAVMLAVALRRRSAFSDRLAPLEDS
jgi:Ice-binding-like